KKISDSNRTPVGALLLSIINHIAWYDPVVRDIADYFRLADLGGSGDGNMRPWPQTVFSKAVQMQVDRGGVSNGALWDEWSYVTP
ncbi:hypothetical protein, partial [Elstera litoralis]